jgi:hypothetical protein
MESGSLTMSELVLRLSDVSTTVAPRLLGCAVSLSSSLLMSNCRHFVSYHSNNTLRAHAHSSEKLNRVRKNARVVVSFSTVFSSYRNGFPDAGNLWKVVRYEPET